MSHLTESKGTSGNAVIKITVIAVI